MERIGMNNDSSQIHFEAMVFNRQIQLLMYMREYLTNIFCFERVKVKTCLQGTLCSVMWKMFPFIHVSEGWSWDLYTHGTVFRWYLMLEESQRWRRSLMFNILAESRRAGMVLTNNWNNNWGKSGIRTRDPVTPKGHNSAERITAPKGYEQMCCCFTSWSAVFQLFHSSEYIIALGPVWDFQNPSSV